MFDSKLKKELAAERERALKSEALDHAMHDHLLMIEFTTDGYILDASPLFLHSVGYSLNEIVQQGEIVNILLKIKNSFLPTKQILIGL